MMKYLCLLYIDGDEIEDVPASECLAYAAELGERGQCLAAEALRAAHTATTVRVRGDTVSVTDGPYAETKELLAGFYLLDTDDMDDAIRLISASPTARHATIEVRPLVPGGWPPG